MQLSLPGVGYGVLESPVDSGNVYKHPFKRARTTGTYLAVATIGTESDRALIRDAVDVVHRQVRSTSSSPVSYNAFDPKLQLWVAACLYRYFVDQHEFLYGPLDDATADAVYHDAKRLGTTLQVPERMWPPDRVAFDEYWKRSLDELRIDPPVREHLHGVASMAFLPWPLRALAGPFNLFATTGFLAPEFRSMMQLDWSESQQRRFESAAVRPAAGRPADSAPRLDFRLSALPVGHAVSRASRPADRLGRGPGISDARVSLATLHRRVASQTSHSATLPRKPRKRGLSCRAMTFPGLNHVALTVRDLEVSAPWYRNLLGKPAVDEQTDGGFRHLVWVLGGRTLFGIHQHDRPAPDEKFSEFRVGLDHVAFGCANRAELETVGYPAGRAGHRARRHRGRVLRLRVELSGPRRHRVGVLRTTRLTSASAESLAQLWVVLPPQRRPRGRLRGIFALVAVRPFRRVQLGVDLRSRAPFRHGTAHASTAARTATRPRLRGSTARRPRSSDPAADPGPNSVQPRVIRRGDQRALPDDQTQDSVAEGLGDRDQQRDQLRVSAGHGICLQAGIEVAKTYRHQQDSGGRADPFALQGRGVPGRQVEQPRRGQHRQRRGQRMRRAPGQTGSPAADQCAHGRPGPAHRAPR